MSKIYNVKTKRYNSVKTAIKNDILTKPDDFTIPEGKVLVKTGRGHELVERRKAAKYVKKESDLIAVNKKSVFNPKTKRVVTNTKVNVKKVKVYKKSVKEERINKVISKQTVDKIYGFENIRYTVDVNNKKELYKNIKKRLSEEKRTGNVTLEFAKIDGGQTRRITIGANYLDSLDDFLERLDDIMQGNVVGSDNVPDDEYKLLMNVYNIIFVTVAGNGLSDKIIFNCEDCSEDKTTKCYTKVFNHLDMDVKDKKYSFMDNFKEKLPSDVRIVANSFTMKKSCYELFQERPKITYKSKMVVGKKEKDIFLKLVKLENNDIKHVLLHGNDSSKKTVIYDQINRHYDYTENLVLSDDIYMDMGSKLYRKIDDFYELLFTPNQINKTNNSNKGNTFYLFFDYETVVDFNESSIAKEYSISFFICRPDQLEVLDALDKGGNMDKLREFYSDKVINFVGYDCSEQFIRWIKKNQIKLEYGNKNYDNVRFDLISFNGSNFDNIILLRKLLMFDEVETDVSNIFYNGNQLLNFSIDGRHTTFDVAKHLMGSLSYNCKSFGVKCIGKSSFDHYKAQKLYDEGKLIEFMTGNDELIDYNNRDVLSLAVIFQRYREALQSNSYSKKYGADLTNNKTIGSVIWHIAGDYWAKLNVDHTKKVIVKEEVFKTGKNGKQLKTKKTIKKVIEETMNAPINFPKMDYKLYKDILKYKCAGRVEMFNGIQEIDEEMVSLDICSMYPYVMAVMEGAWYPYGELIETDVFVDNKIGFYYCDIDQSNLKGQNLPNIYPEKVHKIKKDGSEGELIENDWQTKNVLEDYCISSVMIKQLRKYGCKVTIKKGNYFSDKIRGCDLFRFILDFMLMKNEQDIYKSSAPEKYNSALRETLKLIMNSLSGKVIEGLHTEKVVDIDSYKYMELMENKKVESVSCINIVGNKVFATATYDEEAMINKQRPIFLGVLIYDYAKCYIYDNAYAVIGLDRIIYTDTDACKFRKSELDRPEVKKFYNQTYVPYWNDVLKYDDRYEYFKMFDNEKKVFGSFENELSDINHFDCFQKKSWIGLNKEKYAECVKEEKYDEIDKYYKMSFKGVPKNAIMLTGDEDFVRFNKKGELKLEDDMEKEANDYANTQKKLMIKNNLIDFARQLHDNRYVYVLTTQLRRVIKNTNRNVKIDQFDKFNQLNNTIQFLPIVKKICIAENNI